MKQTTGSTPPPAPQWWDLGQHQYSSHEQAKQKQMQMRDDGHVTKITSNAKKNVFAIKIFCT